MYHGTEPLCQEKQSRQVILTTFKSFPEKKYLHSLSQVGPAVPKWVEWLNMDINVCDIPRFVLNLFFCF